MGRMQHLRGKSGDSLVELKSDESGIRYVLTAFFLLRNKGGIHARARKLPGTRRPMLDHVPSCPSSRDSPRTQRRPQNSSLRAFAAKALTTVLAGFAFTNTTLPNISRFPALVAGFLRVLIITKPGTTNLPFFSVSAAAMLARVLKALPITPFFTSQLSAIAAVNAVLVITVPFIIGAISVATAGRDSAAAH